jgi:hypothetical protein
MLVRCMTLFIKHNYGAKKLNNLTLKCSTQREQGLAFFSICQPIVKKLPKITKSLPCCMGYNPVLLKIPMSQFIIVELIDENMKNVVP